MGMKWGAKWGGVQNWEVQNCAKLVQNWDTHNSWQLEIRGKLQNASKWGCIKMGRGKMEQNGDTHNSCP